MEGFLIQGMDLIVAGCGGTSPLPRRATPGAHWLHEPQATINQPSASSVGVSTPRGAVFTRGMSVSSLVC